MKKNIVVLSLFLSLFLFVSCSCNNTQSSSSDNSDSYTTITIKNDGSFSDTECSQRGLQDKVIMLESKYCSACKNTLSDFKEACSEKGVEPIVLDVSISEQRQQMESYAINIMYTPTFIFGCDYFIGSRNKTQYLELLEKFKNNK